MKKFLTVLLALSVVFTYTVGTAFAVTAPTDAQKDAATETAQKAMKEAVEKYAGEEISYTTKGLLKDATGYTVADGSGDVYLTQTAVAVGVKDLIAHYNKEIADATKAETDVDNLAATAEGAWKTDLADNDTIGAKLFANPYLTAMYTKAISDAKADANAKIDKYNPANYSGQNLIDLKAAISDLRVILDAATDNNAATLKAVSEGIAAFDTAVKDLPDASKDNENLEKLKFDTKQEIAALGETFRAAEKTALEAILNNASKTAAEKADAQIKLNALDSNVAALVSLYSGQVDAVVIDDKTTAAQATTAVGNIKTTATTTFDTADSAKFYAAVENLGSVELLVKYATDYAAQMKMQYDATTGLAKYNAATVDKQLEKVIKDINNLKLTSYSTIKVEMDNTQTAAQESTGLIAAKAQAIKDITEGNYVSTKWSDTRKDAVEAIQKDYKVKINAATTKDEVDALVKEARKAMDAYLNDTQVTAVKSNVLRSFKSLGYATSADGMGGTLEYYAKAVVAKDPKAYSDDTVKAVVKAAADVLYDAVLEQNNEYLTQTQIQQTLRDNYGKATAVIDAIKTDAEINASANAIVEAIKALPTTVTVENKAQYLEVQKMLEDYMAVPGAVLSKVTNFSTFKTYMSRLITLERNAVEALIRTLPATVTIDSKAAIEAARTANDDFDKTYKAYVYANEDGFKYGYTSAINLSTLESKEALLSQAKLVDAAKKIADLPTAITAADKAAVEAAKAAYDSLDDAEKAVFSKALVEKLEAAVKALGNADAAAVEALKITASSTAGKGYIKVKWTVKGDASKADGYQVYRSVKRNSGYGTKPYFTTKAGATTYKNTKSLKKGTRYYYKVRAFKVVDGKNVYSDWSNKAYRIAK